MLNWPLYTRSIQLPGAENASIKWSVQVMLAWPLYTRSIPLPRAENPSIKWPVQVKTEKTTVDVGLATLYPLHPAPPSKKTCIKWPAQVKPWKNYSRCWTGHFIPAPSRSPEQSPRAENNSIKLPIQVKNNWKNNSRCWTGHFIPAPSSSPEQRIPV